MASKGGSSKRGSGQSRDSEGKYQDDCEDLMITAGERSKEKRERARKEKEREKKKAQEEKEYASKQAMFEAGERSRQKRQGGKKK